MEKNSNPGSQPFNPKLRPDGHQKRTRRMTAEGAERSLQIARDGWLARQFKHRKHPPKTR